MEATRNYEFWRLPELSLPAPTGVPHFQEYSILRGAPFLGELYPQGCSILRVSHSQGCSIIRGAPSSGVLHFQGCSILRGAPFSGVLHSQVLHFQGYSILRCAPFSGAPFLGVLHPQGAPSSGVPYSQGCSIFRVLHPQACSIFRVIHLWVLHPQGCSILSYCPDFNSFLLCLVFFLYQPHGPLLFFWENQASPWDEGGFFQSVFLPDIPMAPPASYSGPGEPHLLREAFL